MRYRRPLLVIILLVMLAVGAGAAVFFRQQLLDQRALEAREVGMQAALSKDHEQALHQVGRYLQRFGLDEDVDALYEYAVARKNVPQPNAKHLQSAMAMLIRVLEVNPEHSGAQHELLDLYLNVGYGQETFTLAQRILDKNPDDVAALRAEAQALVRLRKFEEARERTTRIAELDPEDIENHLFALSLMQQLEHPADDILAYPATFTGPEPKRGKHCLLHAAANEIVGNRVEALQWVERAAASDHEDVQTVLLVNNYLNRFGRFDASLQLLQRSVDDTGDAQLARLLVRRLFESGDVSAVLDRTEVAPLAEGDSTLLALRSMALVREGKMDEVEAIVNELDIRDEDPIAEAWTPVLRALWLGGQQQQPQDVVDICLESIKLEEDNPFFHYFLGLAHERQGENDLAIRAWQNAVRFAPTWSDPILRGASLLVSLGRNVEAARLAQEAMSRSPQSIAVAASAARILGANVDMLTENDQQRLFDLVSGVQSASPQEAQTLPIYVDLLARRGEAAEAIQHLQSTLDSTAALPEQLLLQLAAISERHQLGLEQACLDRMAETSGMTPALAYARATSALRDGDAQAGRELLANAAQSAGNGLDWQVVFAQYLDLIDAADATASWATIANENAENSAIQRRVLASKTAWQDTDLIERVIERVQSQTTDDAVTWRVAKARWLLQTDPSEKAAAEALVLINDATRNAIPQADRFALQAAAFERLNNIEGAIESLTQAVQLSNQSNPIRFELIRLHQSRGNIERAAVFLEEVLRNPLTTKADLRRAASFLARQNESARAIDLLLQTHPPDDRETPPDLLLAQLYRSDNRIAEAEAISKRVLDEAPTSAAVEFAADLLASQGKSDEANTVLARLDTMALDPGIRELILAEFKRNHGTAEEAKQQYQAALAALPGNPALWRRYLAFLMRAGQTEEALNLIDEAATASPDDTTLAQLARNLDLLRSTASHDLAQPFLLATIEMPERQDEALRTLELLQQTPDTDRPQLAIQLRRLADRHPTFLPLKTQLVRLYATLGRHDDAATLAAQAMRDFPEQIEPAWLAAEAYAATGAWVEALSAAREWRRRAQYNPQAADLLIATAQIRLDQPANALDTLQPYLNSAPEDPSAYSPILAQQARALVGTGSIDEASELLEGRLEVSPEWRMAWVRLATSDIGDPDVARTWLERVSPLIPEDAVDERVALASAWYNLAERSAQDSYRANARSILESLATRPDVTGNTLLALAIIADRDQNYAAAEASYRLALQRDPTLAVAKNNLAMRYIENGERLDEALQLAQEAVAADQANANFHDTLAQAHAAHGNFDAAVESLARAAELQPQERKWQDRIALMEQRRQSI